MVFLTSFWPLTVTERVLGDYDVNELTQLVLKLGRKLALNEFAPKKFNSINSTKQFTMAPLHKFRTRYVTFNKNQIFCILRNIEPPFVLPPNAEKTADVRPWIFKLFNLERVKVPNVAAALNNGGIHILTGTFRTDMTGIDFLFNRPLNVPGNIVSKSLTPT